jgi:L-2-hydroxyglutarate oxidase LhgO
VAKLAGGAEHPKIVTFRGTYWQMKAPLKDIVKTNVYPVPTGGGIPTGVHFTPTVNERRGHQMIIGPGACLERIKSDAKRAFLLPLAIIPRSALQAHDQNIIANEMRLGARLDQPQIGAVGPHVADLIG